MLAGCRFCRVEPRGLFGRRLTWYPGLLAEV